MKFYLDITLLPNAEATLGFLWQKVYGQLHLALVEMKMSNGNSAIAVSFPEYGDKKFPLGSKLRLLSPTQEQLQQLDIGKWLNRLTDYSHCTPIKKVPESVSEFVRFKRVQFDTNVERLARRRAKRKGESMEQALKHFYGFKDRESKLPFINMNRLSKNKRFRLFIEKKIAKQKESCEFTCYGLSNQEATVPEF
ncbi:type I-F CRISPR-associated endoribonuclease Cas6/Csy4 [Candidatus Spongiihabitans sp.]|uniref:type I-F CRISPR-associated endoribonuclease Cas6/Csy4 n=1 Tax=Candidatus Spongiihabitans sp. TaxID=3101308 RepID=UPI003C6FF341